MEMCGICAGVRHSPKSTTFEFWPYFRQIIITSSDDIQPSTLITDQSPSGLLLDIKVQEYCICLKS